MAQTEEESRRLAEELINATNALSQFSGMLYGQSAEQLKATQADKDAKEAASKFAAKMDAASEAAKALAGVFINYNKEVYKSGNANKAAAASIDAMGEAAKYAGVFLALLVPGGPLVKGLVAGIGLLTSELIKSGKLIAEQTDEIYKAYQDMARAGAAGAGGMQDVFDSLQKVGMGTEKFGAYLKLVNENANDLAMFGGTVRTGRKEFEKTMGSFSSQQRVQMEQMGLDRESQAAATMAYIKQQRLLTMGTKTQMDTSSAAVMRYINETDALTRITGANREEQQKLLDKAMSEEIFASFLDELESQGEEGKQRAAVIRANNIVAEKLLGPETAQGIRDSLTGFIGASQASQKAFMASNGQVSEYADTIRNTTMTQEQGMKEFEKLNKSIADTYTTQQRGLAQMGVSEGVYGKVSENRRAVAVEQLGIEKSLLKAEKEREDALADPKTKQLAEAMNATVDQQLKLQRGVNMGMDAYITGLKTVSNANATALDVLGNAAYKAAEYLGIIGGGKKVQQSAAVQDATKATSATRDTAKPLQDRVDALNKQLDEDEKALKDGKRAGKSVAEMAALEEKILKAKEEHLKAAQELDAQEKVIKESALKEREIRQKQVAELGKMNRLQKAADIEKEEIETLKEKKYNLEKALANSGKPGGTGLRMGDENARALAKEYEEKIAKKEAALLTKTTEIGDLQKKLAPAGGAAPPASGGGVTSPSAPAPQGMTGPEPHAPVGSGGGKEEKPKLTRISSKSGPSASVNEKYASRFQGLVDWLDGQGYAINSLGGYVDRDVRGQPGVKSVHAHGAAIDINPSTNPLGSKLVTDMPANIASVAKQMGLGWGGNWTSIKDAMHFSVAKNEGGDIQLADGGIVPARPGGTRAVIGEGGQDEAVIPLKNGKLPVHIDSAISFGGHNELKGYNAGALTTDLAALKQIAGKLGAYDSSTKMITDPKLWKEILQSGMLMNYDLGMAQVGTKDLSSRVGSENVADAIAGRIKELIDTKKDSSEAIAQTRTEFADMMKTFYEDFFAKMNAQQQTENPLDAEMLATLKEISRTNAAAAGASEKMLRYTQN